MTDARQGSATRDPIPDPDQNIYRKRRDHQRYNKIPWSAYFYYVERIEGEAAQPLPPTRYHYVSHHGAIKRKRLRTLITQLTLNARLEDPEKQNPRPIDPNTELFWRRRSYVIVVVDDPKFKFEKNRAIQVLVGDFPNYALHDAKDVQDIELPRLDGHAGTEHVTAVFFTNHMKRSIREDDILPDEKQKFLFGFNPPLPAQFREDDGGTNMGPPVPPP